jgi:hypothetical protein
MQKFVLLRKWTQIQSLSSIPSQRKSFLALSDHHNSEEHHPKEGVLLVFFPFFASGNTRRVSWEIWSRPLPDSLGFFSLSLSLVSLYSGLLCTLSSSRAFSLRFRGRVRGSELGGHTVYVCVCVCEERERESVCVCVCV